jgi:hypothetical protein
MPSSANPNLNPNNCMKNFLVRLSRYLAAACLLCAGRLSAADSTNTAAKTTPPPKQVTTTAAPAVVYKFAKGSAPSARVTGGSRGSGDATVTLDVLAPDETGLTTEEQPSLFWYQSKPAKARFELTLTEDEKTKPVFQVNVDRASKAGIQRLRLADQGVKLALGVEYKWVVALVTDPNNRSTDLVASGFIKRIEPSPELKAKIAGASASSVPTIYAEAGIWHDAVGSLSDQIEAQPDNKALVAARADLLCQVGLKAAAAAAGPQPGS